MSFSNGTTWTYNTGTVFLDGREGEKPKEASRSLLSTRAIQTMDGWVGQIIMSGEIVYETKAQEESEDALEIVSEHIHKRLKKLIVGG